MGCLCFKSNNRNRDNYPVPPEPEVVIYDRQGHKGPIPDYNPDDSVLSKLHDNQSANKLAGRNLSFQSTDNKTTSKRKSAEPFDLDRWRSPEFLERNDEFKATTHIPYPNKKSQVYADTEQAGDRELHISQVLGNNPNANFPNTQSNLMRPAAIPKDNPNYFQESVMLGGYPNQTGQVTIPVRTGLLALSFIPEGEGRGPKFPGNPSPEQLTGQCLLQMSAIRQLQLHGGCDNQTTQMLNLAQSKLLGMNQPQDVPNLNQRIEALEIPSEDEDGSGVEKLSNSVLMQMNSLRQFQAKFGCDENTKKMIDNTESRLVND